MFARWLLLLSLFAYSLLVYGDRRREPSRFTTPSTEVKLVLVSENHESANVTENGGSTQKPKNVTKSKSVTESNSKPATTPHPQPKKNDANSKRRDMWYLKPKIKLYDWKNDVYGHKKYPTNYRDYGRWWYYRGSLKNGRKFLTRFRYNHHYE